MVKGGVGSVRLEFEEEIWAGEINWNLSTLQETNQDHQSVNKRRARSGPRGRSNVTRLE